jgi:hypothetical protein
MSDPWDPWDVPALLAGVRLVDDPVRAGELAGRLPSPSEPRAVSVSDLLAPRRAFWRRLRGPAPVPLDREVQLERGRAWHRRLGDALASEGTLEVRIRRGGLSGRIDLLADVPVEIKTGAPAPDGRPPEDWPDQVEQLAIYCLLVGSSVGRLAHVELRAAGPPTVTVGDLRFRGLEAVGAEVATRQEELSSALAAGRPDRLARCRWFDRGCEYRAAGVCACHGDEARERSSIASCLDGRTARPDLAARWTAALGAGSVPASRPPAHFRDLLNPRRAYFDRTTGRPPAAFPPRPPSAPVDAYERTLAALERGPVGEVHRLPVDAEAPEEDVLAWRGFPCLVRSSRVRPRLTPADVRGRFPQYLVDLGLRCAATGTTEGTIVIGYEPAVPDERPVQVFRVELAGGGEPFARAARARCAALDGAVRRGTPAELPSCPGWMATSCPYRDVCGCATDAARSQR